MAKRKTLSGVEIRKAASKAVQRDDLQEQVRDLTLSALKDRRLEASRIKDVVSAVTEGVNLGLARHTGNLRDALSDAFAGLDEALSKAAEASHLALRELASRADDVNRRELRRVLREAQRLEEQFLSAVRRASASAGKKTKDEWRDLLVHARRAGTDTGARVEAITRDFSSNLARVSADSAKEGFRSAKELSARFFAVSSGVLAGIADALRDQAGRSRAARGQQSRPRRTPPRQ